MHADEIEIDAGLVRRLLAAQFPRWADLPLARVRSAGTDNAMYRLGEDMVVRLPRLASAAQPVEKEQRWLPRLAPLLPLAVPDLLAAGVPGSGYPWRWSVLRWLAGANATPERVTDGRQAAVDLGRFVAALRAVDTTGAPAPEPRNSRGVPLASHDAAVRRAIAALDGTFPGDALSAAWDAALRAPAWRGPGVWFHGDLHVENLLARDGRLSAVIDFGCLAVGDPACDVMAAWLFVAAEHRDAFRGELSVDDDTWNRARGWALFVGVLAAPYYRDTNPVFAAVARRAIAEVLADRP